MPEAAAHRLSELFAVPTDPIDDPTIPSPEPTVVSRLGGAKFWKPVVGDEVSSPRPNRKHTSELGVTLEFLGEFVPWMKNGLFWDDKDFTTDDVVEKFVKPEVK
eukprot:9319641-Pyramimonas_sp.AAC.1